MLYGSILTYDLRPLKLQQGCIAEGVIFGRRMFQISDGCGLKWLEFFVVILKVSSKTA